MTETRSRSTRSVLTSTIIMILVVGGCIASTGLFANWLCTRSLTQKLPIYPDATIVWEGHNLFTAFGMGETYMELHTPDDRDKVHEWYNRYSARLLRERASDQSLTFGTGRWEVNRLDDGVGGSSAGGSQIVLHGVCMQ